MRGQRDPWVWGIIALALLIMFIFCAGLARGVWT